MSRFAIHGVLGLVALGLLECAAKSKPPAMGAATAASGDANSAQVTNQSSPLACRTGRCNSAATPTAAPVRCDVELCDGELEPSAILELRTSAEKAYDCYEQELKEQNQLEGKMMVRLRLAAGREPCEIRIEEGALTGSDTFRTCVTERLRQTQARPTSGCIDVALPLSFVRKEVESMPDASSGAGAAGGAGGTGTPK